MTSTAAGAHSPSVIDRWIDAVFGLAADPTPVDRRVTMRAFQKILLLHLSARLWVGQLTADPSLMTILAVVLAACLAANFVERLAPLSIAVAFCAMLAVQHEIFPLSSNHSFLELWILFLTLVIGANRADEAATLTAALRLSVAIMIFYTGLQKLLYGTYFEGQFLLVQMALRPEFANALGWMLPAEEFERFRTMIPGRVGAGPFETDAPLFLLASNVVYLFELSIPVLLLWKRTRRAAVVMLGVFTVAIQSGAMEFFFGGLLVNLALLFWPSDLHRRALPLFVAFYATLVVLDSLDLRIGS